MQRRQHPRVRLRLSARLRWSTPLGQQTEKCEALNASRGGLLLKCFEQHRAGYPLWVTFPFDAESLEVQPETFARVLRSEKAATVKETAYWNIAVHFERGSQVCAPDHEKDNPHRQNGAGRDIALPIRVRPLHIPWPEETMTTAIEPNRVRFLTHREYKFGERLMVSFVSPHEGPWNAEEEWEAEVTGIEMYAGLDCLQITVRKTG